MVFSTSRLVYKFPSLTPVRDRLSALVEPRVVIQDQRALERMLEDPGHDACGINAIQSHCGATREVVDLALKSLCGNDIRGGRIVDRHGRPTGDGAGMMLRTNNDEAGHGMQGFLRQTLERHVPLTRPNENLHMGVFFIDTEQAQNLTDIKRRVHRILQGEGFAALGWSEVPTDSQAISPRARAIQPLIFQTIYGQNDVPREEMERRLFNARVRIQNEIAKIDVVSLQPGTVVFKAMCRGEELAEFYSFLKSPELMSDAALTHTRFGTNLLARWILAQPFGSGHNGEINNILVILATLYFLERNHKLQGTNIMKSGSDSANLDRALQFLTMKGLSLAEAVRFMIHPAADDLARMPQPVRDYIKAVARIAPSLRAMGPIALLAMNQDMIVAQSDGMGLRPLRWSQLHDGLTIMGSEYGIPHVDFDRVRDFGQFRPGEQRILKADGTFHDGAESFEHVVSHTTIPYARLAHENIHRLTTHGIPKSRLVALQKQLAEIPEDLIRRANVFGLNVERLRILKETLLAGMDPVKGMGSDRAMPGLSPEPHSLAGHFRPNYSQVSNPSLDYVREGDAFTMEALLGPTPVQHEFARDYTPLPQYQLDAARFMDEDEMLALYAKKPLVISTLFKNKSSAGYLERLNVIKDQVVQAATTRSHTHIVLSDRGVEGANNWYISPHHAITVIRHALAEAGVTNHVAIVMDTGEVLDQHEYAMLLACGADGIHPRMMYQLIDAGKIAIKTSEMDYATQKAQLKQAFVKTVLRYMGRNGIPDLSGFHGGKGFSTLGLDSTFVQTFFGDGIPTTGSGPSFEAFLAKQFTRFDPSAPNHLRRSREVHGYADQIHSALEAVGEEGQRDPAAAYAHYLRIIDEQSPLSFQDLFRFRTDLPKVPIEEVISEEEIIAQMIRGAAMSVGALNDASHRAVQLLFKEFGSYMIEGEGGQPRNRYPGEMWEAASSPVPQFASGRFGIDAERLCDPRVKRIEIKIGQGAKPGVAGHLKGEKVMHLIAAIRGVGLGQELISPTTHHDLYSIEELEEMIDHLSALNPAAIIDVKLTSGANVGNIAVGVAKGQKSYLNKATDIGKPAIGNSGFRGGTAAATETDRHHTGIPTEWGTVDVHRKVTENGLRDDELLRSDGGVRCGRDALKLVAWGADEVALATFILIAQQKCIFCGSCDGQTVLCPASICRPSAKFLGAKKGRGKEAYPEDDQLEKLLSAGRTALWLFAHEMRHQMADIGARTLDDVHARFSEVLEIDPRHAEAASDFDLSMFQDKPQPAFREMPLASGIVDTVLQSFSDRLYQRLPLSVRRRLSATRQRGVDQMEEVEQRVADKLREVRDRTKKLVHPKHYNPEHIEFYLNNPRVNATNRRIIEAILAHPKSSGSRVDVNLGQLYAQDRSVGATAFGLRIKKLLDPRIKEVFLHSTGDVGHGYGFGLIDGFELRHRGRVENGAGNIQSGGRLVVLSPKEGCNNLEIVGNNLRYGARGGDAFIQGSVGERACVRETRGRTVISGNAGKYFAEFKVGGRDTVLGELYGQVGAGMSGGCLYARDLHLADKLHEDAQITAVMCERDYALIRQDLQDFYNATGDLETQRLLTHWETEKLRFNKVVAKTQYADKLFEFFYNRLENHPYEEATYQELLSDLLEMCGLDVDLLSDRSTLDYLSNFIEAGIPELQALIQGHRKAKDEDEIETRFKLTKRFAHEFTERVRERFLIEA